jgi:arginase
MKGLQRHQPDILWYDAHGDFNTPETSPSGFLGGMPLAWLVGHGDMRYMEGIDLKPTPENRVTITDARNLDPGEAAALQASEVRHLKAVEALCDVTWSGKPLYIHLDTDVVDAAEMPAKQFPEPNGPTIETIIETLQHVAHEANVVGALFTLWHDNTLPDQEQTCDSILRLVRGLTTAM